MVVSFGRTVGELSKNVRRLGHGMLTDRQNVESEVICVAEYGNLFTRVTQYGIKYNLCVKKVKGHHIQCYMLDFKVIVCSTLKKKML